MECFSEEICDMLVEVWHLFAFTTGCVTFLLLNVIMLLPVKFINVK